MTEDEAKKRWCPFARIMVTVDSTADGRPIGPIAIGSANRFQDDKIALCIASACMAWRWNYVDNRISNADGYCGLAGSRGQSP